MAWVKIDDRFDQHPKVETLTDAAVRLHVAGLCYCNRGETDGKIPPARVLLLTETATADVLAELLEAGMWDEHEAHYEIHDYLKYQPSKAQLEEERQKAAERKAKWKAKKDAERAERRRNGVPNGVANGVPNGYPDPTRPDPLSPKERERSSEREPPFIGPIDVRKNVPHVQATRDHLKAVVG